MKTLYRTLLTHAFPGMFLKPFKKLAEHVLSGLKPLGLKVTDQRRVQVFHQGFQTPRNG